MAPCPYLAISTSPATEHVRPRSSAPTRAPFREPKRRILIVCEGARTEPDYINGLDRYFRNAAIEVECVPAIGVPLTVVSYAARRKEQAEKYARKQSDDFLKFDTVWCVVDVDEHPHLNEARQLARAREIELAISNPCFELWLLLHFREPPGARHRHDLCQQMREHIPAYDKKPQFTQFVDGVEAACRRAERLDLDAENENEPGRNPTTGVYRLVASLRGQ